MKKNTQKKPYTRPLLKDHGDLASLTKQQSKSGFGGDSSLATIVTS